MAQLTAGSTAGGKTILVEGDIAGGGAPAEYFLALEKQKIQASDRQASDNFGFSVSMSANGRTAIVGAPFEDTGGSAAGAAYIFTSSNGTTWTQQQKIQASDKQAGDRFGYSVSISANGRTVIVGAPEEDNTGGSAAGAAYIFTSNGSTWTQQQKIQAAAPELGAIFGHSVSISADGRNVIVGSHQDNLLPSGFAGNSGSSYIFTSDGTTWTQQQKIQAAAPALGAIFGHSVSISADGRTVIVGAPEEDNTGGSAAGAAYIFTSDGTTWTEQQKIQSSDIQGGDEFGQSVAISSDGRSAFVTAPLEDTGGSSAGAAYFYTYDGTTWTEKQKIQAADKQAGDVFGRWVSISADGRTAIVGVRSTESFSGAAYFYTYDGTTWTEKQKIQASDIQTSDLFGSCVSISANGRTVIVSAEGEDTGGSNAGAAYIFDRVI